jgi:hypothetical protein
VQGTRSWKRSEFDDPFGAASGSGMVFGATGGVMEAALRTVIEVVTGEPIEQYFDQAVVTPVRGMEGVRTAEVTIPRTGPGPGVVREGGGGQPIPTDDTKSAVLDTVHDLWVSDRFTMISVVHDTDDAVRLADRVITLPDLPDLSDLPDRPAPR